MNQTRSVRGLLLLLALLLPLALVAAEDEDNGENSENGDKKEEEKKPKTIAEVTEDSERIDGLFTLFRNKDDGTVHMLITSDQVDKEFIYFTFVKDGVVEGGHFRGAFWDNSVFSVRRHFDRIEFVKENTSFYFDPDNALFRSADANISHAILEVEESVAKDEDKDEYLIAVDDVFLGETFTQIKPSPDPDAEEEGFSLGKLSEEKSKISELRNYPDNTDVVVEYVYETDTPEHLAEGPEVTDSRFVRVTYQHSLIRMPENDFQPRFDDPRVGYFVSRQTDMTSTEVVPYRDMITRWNLVKKDPDAALSEPVEPIVFWIENTTPVELRPVIKKAGEAWNLAFEKAGFRNAFVVKEQPDDAEWDAGDVRYNVLRWTSSPTPPFGGYGPSFVNPRTGQIIGADIMLEFVFVTNRMRRTDIFSKALLFPEHDKLIGQRNYCAIGDQLHQGMLFGMSAAYAAGADDIEVSKLVEDGLYFLILHEIGHTLGLNHNMKASQMLSVDGVNDVQQTEQLGVSGSVMDYPAINLAGPGREQGQFYSRRPGPYDDWAIEFGYSPATGGAASEGARLEAILARSTEHDLLFGNDADDMRVPGRGIDPRTMIGDMSSDNIGYAMERMELVNDLIPQLQGKLARPGQSWQEVLNSFAIVNAEYLGAAQAISRHIGGVYVDRAMVGQEGAGLPFTAVPASDQKRAMAALNDRVFAPDAFEAPQSLYKHLQAQRRDFDFYKTTEDPKIHGAVLAVQQDILGFLLNATTMQRISDSQLYGNEYALSEVMGDLTDAVFDADSGGDVNSFRQNLQIDYVNKLIGIAGTSGSSSHDYLSQSAALYNLQQIRDMLGRKRGGDAATRAHTAHALFLIDKALDTG
ncbi:MAG: DUF5117 domain-containing protein [Gemmatimonadales bacterium]|nr:MAG: DUF5117 domain-containing protein [Gemmatimonadales bacterium]